MKRIAIIAAAALGLAGADTLQASEALAKSGGCLTCHATAAKKVGPSFKDTAAKYKGKPDAEATVLAKLADEKAHPPAKGKPEDVKAVVKWILAM